MKRELWGIKSDYSAPQRLKGQYAVPFFFTERPELCLLAQPIYKGDESARGTLRAQRVHL